MSKIDKSIIPYNNKGERHGYWERYCYGKLWYKSLYNNGEIFGYEEWYDWNNSDKLIRKKYYL